MKLEIQRKVTLAISWKEPDCKGPHGIEGYMIYYAVANNAFKRSDLIKCCDYKLSNLKGSTDYEVYVVAVDGRGIEGIKSKIGKIKTECKSQNKELFTF